MISKPFDEIEIGEKRRSGGRTITETDIVMFCYMTGNFEGIHANEEHAKHTRYGTRVAAGRMLYALTSGVLGPFRHNVEYILYGVDKIRFINAVVPGDTLYYESTIAGKEIRDEKSGFVTIDVVVKNQRDEIVMASTERLLCGRQDFGEE